MQILKEVPPRWWAILVGVIFGSLALVAMNGPSKGYGKTIVAAVLTAPLLSLIAGAMLREDTSLEMAAVVGGIVSVGGMGVIIAVAKMAPTLVTAALSGAARSYLEIIPTEEGKHPKVKRIDTISFPEEHKKLPNRNPELDDLIKKIDRIDNKQKGENDGT